MTELGVVGPRRVRRLVSIASIAGLLSGGGCGASRGPAAAPVPPAPLVAAPPPPPLDVDGRLPPLATPERYRLSLRVDPGKDRFSGVASIDVTVPAPTWNVVLNGRDLHVTRAVATTSAPGSPGAVGRAIGAAVTPRRVLDSEHEEEIVLTFAEPLPAGSATLALEYDAAFTPDLTGLYRVEQGGRSYVFSQFEAADARRAMPCFDEPAYKTPYEVTITSPRGVMALSNAPEVATEDGPEATTTHRFAPTPPLPSYLVALAVGDFDVAEGRRSPVPIRIVTTKGRASPATQVAAALEAADGLVTTLATYFGMPYPYAKLDLVAVPDLSSGAMENPGLLTFREGLLVQDPARSTTWLRRAQAVTIAHELAHQWFGDLVTMRWWDDLWLNEGFATWAEAMAVDAWQPSFGATLDELSGLGGDMDADALASARAVRQPVRSTTEADEAFDGLTYDKGAAVLRMIERWIGPDTFRRGVQRYLRENAWKTAKAGDLFRALDYVSAEHVEPFASAFLDRAGVPEVFARRVCTAGKSALELREGRWLPLGEPSPSTPVTWTLPVCVAAEGHKDASCFTVGPEPIARELGGGCPAWVHPNADQVGYYRFVLDGPQMLALARAGRALDPIQRFGVLSNGWAAVRAGAMDASVLLEALKAFDGESDRRVMSEMGDVLRGIGDALVDDPVRDRYESFVVARLAPQKRALGWEASAPPSSADADDRAIRRRTVLSLMGEVGHDATTLREAEAYAQKWLRDPSSVPGEIAGVAVPMASIRAGKERLDALRAVVKRTESGPDRTLALRAMGSFEDPAVLFEAFDAAVGGEVKLSELRHVFGAALDLRAARPALYAWEKAHWAGLGERLPGSFGRGQLVAVAGALCSVAERAEARAFFAEATKPFEALRRPLEGALESSGLCVALREHGAADVARYLARN